MLPLLRGRVFKCLPVFLQLLALMCFTALRVAGRLLHSTSLCFRWRPSILPVHLEQFRFHWYTRFPQQVPFMAPVNLR